MDYILLSAIYYGIIGVLKNAQFVKVHFLLHEFSYDHEYGLLIDVQYNEPDLLKEFGISMILDERELMLLQLNNKTVGACNLAQEQCSTIGRELGVKLAHGLDVATQQERQTKLQQPITTR